MLGTSRWTNGPRASMLPCMGRPEKGCPVHPKGRGRRLRCHGPFVDSKRLRYLSVLDGDGVLGESRGRVGGLRTDRRRIEKAGKRTQYCSYARYKRTRWVGGTVRGRLRGVDPRMGFDGRADGTASTKRPPSRNGPSGYQRIPWPRRTIEFSTRGFWIPTRLMEWLRHLYQPRAELALVTFGPAMARLHFFSPSGATPMVSVTKLWLV